GPAEPALPIERAGPGSSPALSTAPQSAQIGPTCRHQRASDAADRSDLGYQRVSAANEPAERSERRGGERATRGGGPRGDAPRMRMMMMTAAGSERSERASGAERAATRRASDAVGESEGRSPSDDDDDDDDGISE